MPIHIGIGISAQKDTLKAVKEALRLAKENLTAAKANLAIVFSTIEFANPDIQREIGLALEPAQVLGLSSFAIITNQGILNKGIAIMLLGVSGDVYLNTAFIKNISAKSASVAGEELADKLLYGFKNIRRTVSMVFSDGLILDAYALINGLQEKLGRSFPLVGACASDNLAFNKTYIYYNGQAYSDAACAIVWGGKLNFGLGIKHGWKALGKPRRVTKSKGNIAYEIDGLAAVAVYKDYFASDLNKLRKELRLISILYPIGIYLAGEEEYLLRNILSIEDNGALVLQGNIPEGSVIKLMIGTKESCIAATERAAEEVKNGLYGRQPNFVFVFDSVSRYILLGRQANKEIEIIKKRFGPDTPILGAYTYGEQAPLKAIGYQGRAYFHNQAISVLGLGG